MNRRALFTIFTIVLTDLIGFGIIIPLMPEISQQLGITGAKLGFLVAAYPIAAFFAAPYLGSLSDRYGRRPILLISKIGTIIAYIVFAFAHNYPLLLLSRFIDGFTGGNIPAARAYISDITTKKNRSRGMAIIGIAFGLGFILGPALGGIFYGISHAATIPALVGAFLCFVSLLFTYFFLDESHRANQTINRRPFTLTNFFKIFQHRQIQRILIIQFLVMAAASGFQTTFSFYTDNLFHLDPQQNSYLFVYLGILSLIFQGYLAQHKGTNYRRGAIIGTVLLGIAIILIGLSPNLWVMLLFLALNSAGGSLFNVFLPAMLSTVDSRDPEGEIMGAYEGVSSLGRVIGPAIFGSLIAIYPRPIYIVAGLLTLSAVYFFPRPLAKT